MRITNNMIMDRASSNINGNKISVDSSNTQMTTQKRIDRPSEDPVIAIRSLRLQTSLNKINQYYEKNIPDAESWMDITETALLNIKDVVTDMRTLCVQGSTGTLTPSDRQTILSQLRALQEAVYKEGNADYAGRTVFTGFRTDHNLTFIGDDTKTTYTITEPLSAVNMDKQRYYTNEVDEPVDEETVLLQGDGGRYEKVAAGTGSYNYNTTTKKFEPVAPGGTGGDYDFVDQTIRESSYYRLRLSYDDVKLYEGTDYPGSQNNTANLSYTLPGQAAKPIAKGDPDNYTAGTEAVLCFKREEDWEEWSKKQSPTPEEISAGVKVDDNNTALQKYVPDSAVIFIEETGEYIFGNTLANNLMTNKADLSTTYTKQGFKDGELRPEHYFDCIKTMDEDGNDLKVLNDGVGIKHDKYNEKGEKISYSIDYTVSQNQTLGVNLEACNIFDHNIYQDMGDMIDAVEKAIAANEKVSKIEEMMKLDQFAGEEYQEKLADWLDLANKEMDYYNSNLGKVYSRALGKADGYLNDITLSITKLGCKTDQLKMTEKRMSEQQESVEELKSKNDNLDLSDIILQYTAAYTAYQASLTAAGKLGSQTLLNYI